MIEFLFFICYSINSEDRMNKKGFAVSIILYSIVFLIVAILYVLLGIEKSRYTVNKEIRESIINQINENTD